MFAQQRSVFAEFAMREAQHRGMLQAIRRFICLTADGLLVEAAARKGSAWGGKLALARCF